MAIDKKINTRIQLKHDIEANWSQATGFIPREGEVIIYYPDANYTYSRIKIGDGTTSVTSLPFVKTDLSDILNSSDLQAIEALTGTSGLLKKTAANTWTLDTNSYSTTSHNHNSTYLKLNGSNNMTADVNIIAGDYDRFVNFWYNTDKKAGASWRIGELGTGLEDTNYFVIQSGTSTISDTNWTNALRIGMNTHDINVSSTTPSTTTSTGALTVSGGLGVAGQVTAGILKSGNITIGGTVDTTAGRTISSNNTLYINRGASASIIFSEYNVAKMRIDTSNAFRPETTNTLSIGTSDKKWANVYATNLHGTLATTDLSGIVSTTAKKFLKDTGNWVQVDWEDLTNVPNTFAPSAHEHNYIGKDGFIAYPSDGRYTSSNNTVTGYIKIKIPQTKSSTMFTFDVDIYNYITSTSTRYHIGGYNYNNASWMNCTAYCIAPLSNTKANLTVRFLSNGDDEMYVTIGETDTSWNHPQITIHNIAISFSTNATLAKWKSGWTVTIDSTAFDDSLVKQTITNTNIAYTAENVTGTVAIANGGTGATTANAAANALLSGLPDWTANPSDDVKLIRRDTSGTATFGQIKFSTVWNYIKSKTDTLYVTKSTGVTDIAWDSNNAKLTKTINGTTTDIVTAATLKSAINVTAADLGVSSALRYQGTTTTAMEDGRTTAAVTIGGNSFTPTQGDVVIYNDAEYLWTGSLWELIGAESSFKKVQTAVNTSSASGSSATTFVSSVTQDTQGVITVKTSTLNTSGTWSGTASKATTAADTSNTLYVVGVTSDATTTLKRDTDATIMGGELRLGNNIASPSNGSAYGQLALYSESTAGTYLKSEPGTSWTTASLQAKTGTIALMSDVTESKVEIIRFV